MLRAAAFLLVVPVIAAGLAGCFGGDGDASAPPTPTPPVPTATSTTEARPTAAQTPVRPTPPPTVGPSTRIPSTVWLIDARDGKVITLYEDHDVHAITAYFDDGEAVVLRGIDFFEREAVRFDLDGNELGRAPQGAWGDCTEADGGVEVLGRFYPGVACGPISPDGSWMTYWLEDGGEIVTSPVFKLPSMTRWAIDLESGERVRLQDGLAQCQGDSFLWPAWSASSRYVYFGDCAEDGRTFLSDVVAGTTRQIAAGLPTFRSEPSWSPGADVIVYAATDGSTVLEDLGAGTVRQLTGIPWPARFDATGTLLFTTPGRNDPNETRIYQATTGVRLATLPGNPAVQVPYGNLALRYVPVSAVKGGFLAALGNAPGCAGTAVYSGNALLTCATEAYGPAISPDGASVALSRRVGASGPVQGPGFGSISMDIYDIILVDVATGAETVLASGALGGNPYPTPAFWNDDGTHLLVTLPMLYGP